MPFQNADDGGAAADDDCNVVFRAKVDLACLAPSSHLRCSLAFLPDCVLLHFCLKSNSISFDILFCVIFLAALNLRLKSSKVLKTMTSIVAI